MSTGDDGYNGVEKRVSCKECISHREHSNQIKNIERDMSDYRSACREDTRDMWNSIKEKVPYRHFIAAIGFIITAIGVVSAINYNTMNKVLDSNHRVELKVTQIEAEVKGINKQMVQFGGRLASYEREHDFFRNAIFDLMKDKEAVAAEDDDN